MAFMDLLCPPKDKKIIRMTAELAEFVAKGAVIFKDFIDAYEELADQERGRRVADIKEVEHRCDELSHIISVHMQKNKLAKRQALSTISSMLPVIMDSISSVSKRMVLFHMTETNTEIQQFALLVNNSCKELSVLLQQTGNPEQARKTIVRIHGIEREADYVYNLALADLFLSPKTDVKEIIILKDLYEALETIVDNVEFASRHVENLI
ncbi:MAG: DUF47 family protein [Candidatus Woesearchaeota archaeon]|jgi:uncharacterized protein Yka (UPF0111/DUF47 family)